MTIHRIAAAEVRDAALGIDAGGADAIVISGTNLVTFPVIADIEAASGLPVVSSNQALLWSTLRKAGVADALPLGRLFGLGAK